MDNISSTPFMNQIPPVDLCLGCGEHPELTICLSGPLGHPMNLVYGAKVH